VHCMSSIKLRNHLNHNSTVREWLEDSRARVILEPIILGIVGRMCTMTGSGDNKEGAMNMASDIMDVPLFVVFNYFERSIPMLPDKMMHYLISRVNE